MDLIEALEAKKKQKETHINLRNLVSLANSCKVYPNTDIIEAAKKKAKLTASEQNSQMKFHQLTMAAAIKLAKEWIPKKEKATKKKKKEEKGKEDEEGGDEEA